MREPSIRGYVHEVGVDIASRTGRPDLPHEFQVVNTDVVNAFAVPGGFVHTIRSGRDPRGLLRFFETLEEMRERRPNALEALFTSHPLTEDRIERVRRIIDRIPPDSLSGLRTDSDRYRTMKRSLEELPPPPEEYRVEGDRE